MSTDPTVILILSNVSTASIVALLAFATLEIRKERDKQQAAEARADRVEADKTWAAIQESREHFFAFNPQPLQQHAAIDTAPSLPALSAESHEDEQAPAEDDDHAGAWWLPLMIGPKLIARLLGWAIGLAEVAYERLADAVGEMLRSWQTRNEVGNGEIEGDSFERFRIDDNPRGRSDAEIAAEIAELTGEPVRPVAAVIDRELRKTLYLPTGAVPMVTLTGAEPGRHRAAEVEDAEPVEAVA